MLTGRRRNKRKRRQVREEKVLLDPKPKRPFVVHLVDHNGDVGSESMESSDSSDEMSAAETTEQTSLPVPEETPQNIDDKSSEIGSIDKTEKEFCTKDNKDSSEVVNLNPTVKRGSKQATGDGCGQSAKKENKQTVVYIELHRDPDLQVSGSSENIIIVLWTPPSVLIKGESSSTINGLSSLKGCPH